MATYYVNQAGAGLQNGSSLANAWSMADLNTLANWSATPGTSGQISPGDTVILNGTLTSTLTIQRSGSSGNITTISFAEGAKFSNTNFPGTGVINASGKSYITIDGNSLAGLIENTDNGSSGSYTFQTGTVGVRLTNCTNCIVQGLRILNLYRRTNTTETTGGGSGIRFEALTGGSFNTMKALNNVIDETAAGIALAYRPTNLSYDIEIAYNTVSNINDGITVGNSTDDCLIDDVRIHDNIIHSFDTWDEPATNAYHHDGVHVFMFGGSAGYASNVHCYNNYIYGPFGSKMNSGIYYSGRTPNGLIYNNFFIESGGTASGGFVVLKTYGNSQMRVYNNTMIGAGVGGRGMYLNGGDLASGTVDFRGNYAEGCTFVQVTTQDRWTLTSDYNHGWNLFSTNYVFSDTQSGGGKTTAQWIALGYDVNSIYTDPLLDGSYKLTASSPGRGVAQNLSAYFTTDKDGVARHATDPWDMGAFTYEAAPPTPPAAQGRRRRAAKLLGFL